MVHIWEPTSVALIAELGIMPDLGHAALELPGADAYASYWPELDSFLSAAIYPFKPRKERHPASHAIETDRDDYYMQRPPAATLSLHGLNVERIARDWQKLRDTQYDPVRWNCAGVSKYLLLAAMRPEKREKMEQSLTDLDRASLEDSGDLFERAAVLLSSRFADCAPNDVRCLAETYAKLKS